MNKKLTTLIDGFKRLLSRKGILFLVAAAVLGLVVLVSVKRSIEGTHLGISHTEQIDITPVQIEKIKSIGQWEFLSISDEELIDTVRHGFWGDDELSRIYYGTMRLGIDLHEVGDDWIKIDQDTVVVKLPPIKLLDEKFIDEARTKAFFEEGRWSEADKAQLLERAIVAMKKRGLTPANKRSAEENASAQFGSLLRSMGFKHCRISFHE